MGPGGELPGRLDMSPLPRVDWATQLSGTTFQYGRTDPDTIHRLLTVYDDDDIPMERAAQFLGLSGEEARVAVEEANDAVNALGHALPQDPGRVGGQERAEPPTAGGFSGTSPPKMGKIFYFDSAPEVAAAMRLDADPNVGEWMKGGGQAGPGALRDPRRVALRPQPTTRAGDPPDAGHPGRRAGGHLRPGLPGALRPRRERRGAGGHDRGQEPAAPNQPAYKIAEKEEYGRRVFEEHWGLPFHIWAEDQIGRRFMADLGGPRRRPRAALPGGPGPHRPRGPAQDALGLQRGHGLGGRHRPRGPGPHLAGGDGHGHPALPGLQRRLPLPPVAAEPMQKVPQLISGARNQAAWHNRTDVGGSTFSATGAKVIRPGLGGFMVSVAPERTQRVPGHALTPTRLAQYVVENEDFLEAFEDLHIGTWKTYEGAPRSPTSTSPCTCRTAGPPPR